MLPAGPTLNCTQGLTDPAIVEDEITQILYTVPRYPTTAQITEAFKSADDILVTTFATEQNGKLFHVDNISQLTNGQPIWRKTEMMLYPNFFYSDQSDIEHLLTTSFRIDHIDNYCTEERRLTYNNTRPAIPLSREYVAHPPVLVYYVSKSC